MNLKGDQIWRIIIILSVLQYLFFSIVFVIQGRANDDEGYYLYASKLVYEGKKPYQEFAYTQTPLLPYIYGAVQKIFGPNIYLGRFTSVIITSIAFYCAVAVARKYKGIEAAGITSLLWSTFTYGIFFHSIIKTYPLVTCLFMLVFYLHSTSIKREWKLILSTLCLVLAVLTRLSAFFFAIPWVIYAFIQANFRTKVIICLFSVIALLWILFLFYPAPEVTFWNLVQHHTDRWGDTSNIGKIEEIVKYRIPSIFVAFPVYSLFAVTVISVGYKKIIDFLSRNPPVLVNLLGVLFFTIPHLGTGGWYIEYFFTIFFTLFPIAGILYIEVLQKKIIGSFLLIRVAYKALFISAIATGLLIGTFNSFYINLSEQRHPIQEIKDLSKIISDITEENDMIFAMSALDIVFEADRQALPGLSMAIFSYYPGNTTTARTLKLVNNEIIAENFTKSIPKVIILTGRDWYLIENSDNALTVKSSLNKEYSLYLRKEDTSNFRGDIEIYVRQER